MGYFDKFPAIYYDIKRNRKFEVVVDILRRVKINYNEFDSALYGQYTIKEHDRPDTISEKLYGQSDLHWVILLFNEMHNPYYEWPMRREEVIKYCEDKYPGRAYLLQLDVPANSPIAQVRRRKDHRVMPGDYVIPVTGNQLDLSAPKARVVSWDRTLSKAVVIEEGASLGSNLQVAIAVTGTNEVTASGILRRNQLNYDGLHHFIDDTGTELAPLGSYDALIQSGTKTQSASGTDAYGRPAPLPFAQTLLGAYLNTGSEAQLIKIKTNFEYETEANEARKTILLPHPNLVREVANTFEKIVNEDA